MLNFADIQVCPNYLDRVLKVLLFPAKETRGEKTTSHNTAFLSLTITDPTRLSSHFYCISNSHIRLARRWMHSPVGVGRWSTARLRDFYVKQAHLPFGHLLNPTPNSPPPLSLFLSPSSLTQTLTFSFLPQHTRLPRELSSIRSFVFNYIHLCSPI